MNQNGAIRLEIRKQIEMILMNEALQTNHYSKRVFDRLINVSKITVGYEIRGTYGQYKEVGLYVLPEDIKKRIVENTKIVENYDFNPNKSYAVKISDIPINYNKIEFSSKELMQDVLRNKPTLLFLDYLTESNGNQLYAIIRENKITTAFFAKSYSLKNIESKMRVDEFIRNAEMLKK